MAAELAARGVAPGDRVAVQVEKSAEAVLVYLGCLRRGAIFVPLNPAYTDAETAYLLNDAAPRLFVCDPARQPAQGPDVATLDAAGRGSLDRWRERAPDASIAESAGSDV